MCLSGVGSIVKFIIGESVSCNRLFGLTEVPKLKMILLMSNVLGLEVCRIFRIQLIENKLKSKTKLVKNKHKSWKTR